MHSSLAPVGNLCAVMTVFDVPAGGGTGQKDAAAGIKYAPLSAGGSPHSGDHQTFFHLYNSRLLSGFPQTLYLNSASGVLA